ncbi:MAG: hypothetical protein M3Z16_06430 [Pseudomonadota bacterium]|nr:hypothetical protein [Pseudomonadota bacterium]
MLVLAAFHASGVERPANLIAPEVLEFRIGGFFGSTFELQLTAGAVQCVESQGGRQLFKSQARLSSAQWRALRAELDRLGVWTWRSSYVTFGVKDGTQWSARIQYADRSLSSSGSNSYPDATGKPTSSPDESASFAQFRAALAKLVPGCKL